MLLELRNVTRAFGGLKAVNQVSLELEQGETLGLIGPNGAGKTTLLNVIAGVHRASSGAVFFCGEPVTGLPPETLCRRGISRTFQIARGFPHLTALENVEVATFGKDPGGAHKPGRNAGEWLDFVEFPRPPDTLAGSCTTSQLKRIDLARALASHPRILLLDEIFAGLTHAEVRQLTHLLRSITAMGVALIMVEHLMRVIMNECGRIVVLCSGEKIAEGSPEEIAANPRVVDSYLGAPYA
jgi:branched-chain amino acid transport system ATP-binding protein